MFTSTALPAPITNVAWILGLMAGMGALGKFIDFYVGKTGGQKVKDWLLAGWNKFDDMHWYNFSEVEARYVLGLTDRLLGAKFFSRRRLGATLIIALLTATYLFVLVFLANATKKGCMAGPIIRYTFDWVAFATSITLLATSFSLSRWMSETAIRISRRRWLGPLPYFLLLVVHWLLLIYWTPISGMAVFISSTLTDYYADSAYLQIASDSLRGVLVKTLALSPWEYHLLPPAPPECGIASNFFVIGFLEISGQVTAFLRLLIGLTLLAGFLLREWLARFASTLWARIYEDNQGAFTLLLGGLGAVAGAVKALLT